MGSEMCIRDSSCVLNVCPGSPSAPANGAVVSVPSHDYQSVATLGCNDGYHVALGTPTSTCQADNTWNGPNYSCHINVCGTSAPQTPANGFYVQPILDDNFDATVSLGCNAGYHVQGGGSPVSTCLDTNTWSVVPYVCSINQCPSEPSTPTHGDVLGYSDNNNYQSVATLGCNAGYHPNGVATSTCQADNTWSASNYVCEPNVCLGSPVAPVNGFVPTPLANEYLDIATGECNVGYHIFGDNDYQCLFDNTWSNAAYTCEPNVCLGNPSAPTHGDIISYSDNHDYQSVATLSCYAGYHPNGDATSTCQYDNTWSTPNYVCDYNVCVDLPVAPVNGLVAVPVSHEYLDIFTGDCNSGYNGVGNPFYYCQADNSWSDAAYTCEPNQCVGYPSAPTHGVIISYSDADNYQSVATLSCNTGYYVNGDATSTCQFDNTWSTANYICSPVNCGPLPNLPDGAVGPVNTFHPATYESTCTSGYNVIGTVSFECQANGNWSDGCFECSDWTPYNDLKYKYFDTPLTWPKALDACENLGNGYSLASVHDDVLNQVIYDLAPNIRIIRWLGAKLIRTSIPQVAPFNYMWSDNSTFNYADFEATDPNDLGGNEDCVQMGHSHQFILGGEWNDAKCNLRHGFVCQGPNGMLVIFMQIWHLLFPFKLLPADQRL